MTTRGIHRFWVAALYAATTIGCAAGVPAVPQATATPPAAAPAAPATSIATAVPAPVAAPTEAPTPISSQPTAAPATPVAASTPTPAQSSRAELKPRTTPVRVPTRLQYAFDWAAKEFSVPVDVLLAVGYGESRWEQHNGEPSTSGGYGIMHLTDVPGSEDPAQHTLQTAVKLLNDVPSSPFQVTADDLKTDWYQNVRGGAALLAQYQIQTVGKGERINEGDWYGAVAKYSGAKDPAAAVAFADQVFATLAQGASRTTTSGEAVRLEAKQVTPNKTSIAPLTVKDQPAGFTPDCPPDLRCTAAPALYQLRNLNDTTDVGNFALANRPADGMPIQYIVIHDTEESLAASIKTFQNPTDDTSAHYIVRASDGSVVQMVPLKDVAYHARNWYFNAQAIGVEHEGYAVKGASWYTETVYQSSAKLVRYLAQKYHVPLDRVHIVGHDNVPGLSQASQVTQHWDPGPYWDWDHYMDLLGAPVTAGSNPSIVLIHPSFTQNVQTLAATCTASGCTDLPAQPSNFLWVHTAPSQDAPLVQDLATAKLSPTPGQGTRLPQDWGDQAPTDGRFYRIATQGDWTEIWFGGQKGWIYDPGHQNTLPGDGTLVRIRTDRGNLVPIYGEPYPEITAYPDGIIPASPDPITYVTGGQVYVAVQQVGAIYLSTDYNENSAGFDRVVTGQQKYYEVYFNHRFVFLNAADVEVVSSP